MSITAITEGDRLRVIQASEPIVDGVELVLYTAEEIERLVSERLWKSLPSSSKEEMMFQTQSAAYRDWMEEEEWASVREDSPSAHLPLSEFKPR